MPGGDSQKNLVIPAHLPSPISRQGPVSLLPGPVSLLPGAAIVMGISSGSA